jgi:hypothetical protein
MKTAWIALVSLLFVTAPAWALDPVPLRAQFSDKFVGVSVRDTCPSPDVIAEIRTEGQSLGADYTQIVEGAGVSPCPDTLYGPMWGYHVTTETPDGIHLEVHGGVTVGLHYRTNR